MNTAIALLDLRLRRRAALGYAIGLAVYTFAIVALYPSFEADSSLDSMVSSDPKLMAAFGVTGSLTSPAGWVAANLYNNFLPLIVMILAIGHGAWCIAGQDEGGTLALVAALPVTRTNLVLQKAAAMALQLLPTMVSTFLITLAGRHFDIRLSPSHLIGATCSVLLLGIAFGALALLIGTLSTSRGIALGATSTLAATSYLISSLAPTIDPLRPARLLSPFYWAVGNDPLAHGSNPAALAALAALSVTLLTAATVAIQRTDLR